MKENWWKKAVVYQIYCKSFKDTDGDGLGDLQGVIDKIPYLSDLGIDCIWFNPIYPSPHVDGGYDVADYYGINEEYGGLPAFKKLLETAHQYNIRVLMDMVLNHSSDRCKWFQEARKSKDNPYRNYYIWRDPVDGHEPNNWANYFYEGKGSAWEFDETTSQYYLHYYSVHMPDLNWEYKPLREELYKMMNYWLDMGVDGFRYDVFPYIKKPEGLLSITDVAPLPNGFVEARAKKANLPGIHDFLHEMNERVLKGRDVYTVGEGSAVNPETAISYTRADREELHSLYHFDIAVKNRILKPLEIKEKLLRWNKVYENGGWIAQWLNNHDRPRQVSHFGNDKDFRKESAKMLAVLIHTIPGTPYIYQGEEFGMTNVCFDSITDYNDAYTCGAYDMLVRAGENPKDVLEKLRPSSRDNARTPFQWDDSENAGFTTGTPWIKLNPNYKEINLKKDLESEDSVFRFYQKLIALRKSEEAMWNGNLQMLLPENETEFCYLRETEDSKLLVLLNYSSEKKELILPEDLDVKDATLLLSNYDREKDLMDRKAFLPYEAAIYKMV